VAPEQLVRITGTIDRGDKGTKLRGSKIEPLADVQKQAVKRVHIRLTDRPDAPDQLLRLRDIFHRHPGGTTVYLTFQLDAALEAETAPLANWTVSPSEHFVSDIEEVLGKGVLSLLS
jgi:DNA polymerase-3 subunit alpha